MNEPFMPGHIDQGVAVAAVVEMRKTQFDGDAAALLFRQAIRFGSGQRLDEGRLAVIDVPGQADDEWRATAGISGLQRWPVRFVAR